MLIARHTLDWELDADADGPIWRVWCNDCHERHEFDSQLQAEDWLAGHECGEPK